MYDLSGMSINSNFDVALSARNVDTMTKVACASTGLPLIDQFEFDRTEGISSIVTDVRFYSNVAIYLKTLMGEIFTKHNHFIIIRQENYHFNYSGL